MRRLTPRQLEVVALLCDGLTERAAAECLGIKEGTVNDHVAHAKERLGAKTTEELVSIAIREGLVY
jgi:DNA-binding CsgD family transcriptional regulator